MNAGSWVVLAAIVAAVLVFWWGRRGPQPAGPKSGKNKKRTLDALDTVASWQPEVTRILTAHERQAYKTITQALPDHVVFAQVPLARFLKVPRRHSYGEWFSRVGQINADLLVCDRSSHVLAVVDVHSPLDSARSKQRHERMARVLKAAGVRCVAWTEGAIPAPDAAREQLLPQPPQPISGAQAAPKNLATAALPVLEDEEPDTPMREPMPSTWFDEFDSAPMPLAGAGPR